MGRAADARDELGPHLGQLYNSKLFIWETLQAQAPACRLVYFRLFLAHPSFIRYIAWIILLTACSMGIIHVASKFWLSYMFIDCNSSVGWTIYGGRMYIYSTVMLNLSHPIGSFEICNINFCAQLRACSYTKLVIHSHAKIKQEITNQWWPWAGRWQLLFL